MSDENYISCATCYAMGCPDGMNWDFTQQGEGLGNTIDLIEEVTSANQLIYTNIYEAKRVRYQQQY